MQLEQYRTLWGVIDEFEGELAKFSYDNVDEAVPHLAALGYDGLEMPLKLALFLGCFAMVVAEIHLPNVPISLESVIG